MTISNCFSLWRPAISPSALNNLQNEEFRGCYHDELAVTVRTMIVAAAVFALTLSAFPVASAAIAYVAGHAWYKFDNFWIDAAIDQKAVDLFKEKPFISQSLLDYAVTHVKVANQLIEEPALLEKRNGQRNKTLMQATVDCLSVEFGNEKSHQALEVFKALTKVPGFVNKQLLIHLVHQKKMNSTKAALFLLDNDLIKPEGWTDDEQFELWAKVKNITVMRTLIAKGWNVNVVNRQAVTPVTAELIALGEEDLTRNHEHRSFHALDLQKLCGLLSVGALVPSLDETKEFYIGEKRDALIKATFRGALRDQHLVLAALEQGRDVSPVKLQDETVSFFNFLKPYVKVSDLQGEFRIEDHKIFGRAMVVALAVCAVAFPLVLTAAISPLAQMGIAYGTAGLAGFGYHKFETNRATERLDVLALEAFRRTFPHRNVLAHVAQSFPVAEALNSGRINLAKLDDIGRSIWTELFTDPSYRQKKASPGEFEIFKMVAVQIFRDPKTKNFYFASVLQNGKRAHLEYILRQKFVKPDDFHHEEMFGFLIAIKDPNIAQVLKEQGFNIESRKQGVTALEHLVNAPLILNRFEKVQALLAAKPSAEGIVVAGIKDDSVRQLIQAYLRR